MARDRVRLRYLPGALVEAAGLGRDPLSIPLGGCMGAALGATAGSLFGTFSNHFLLIPLFMVLFAAAGVWLAMGLRKRRGSARDPEVFQAARAANAGAMPGEALAILEACALHRHRVREAARAIAAGGTHWEAIARDASRAADDLFLRALRLTAPFAGRGRGRLSEALRQALEGDLDDALDAFTERTGEVRVDAYRMPPELVPVASVANELKRLATELEGYRRIERAAAQPSETDEILARLRQTREAEQELHRDLNA